MYLAAYAVCSAAFAMLEATSLPATETILLIGNEQIKTARRFDAFFEKVREIKLKGEIIGRIYKLCVLDNGDFVVVDRKDVNIFSSDGDFKGKIGKEGKGPGEYLRPNEVKIDDNSRIYVLDSRLFRVSVFDTAGQYLNSFKIHNFADQMVIVGKGLYIYSADMYQKALAACYEVTTGARLFEFAPPTRFLQQLRSNGIPAPFGFTGSLIGVRQNKVFLLHPYEYLIREFTLEGKELKQIRGKSADFIALDPSVKFTTQMSPAEFFKSDLRTLAIWKEMLLVMFYQNQSKRGFLDIYSTSGDRINRYSIEIPTDQLSSYAFPLAVDKSGNFYSYYQPEPNRTAENLPNPVLVIYRLKE